MSDFQNIIDAPNQKVLEQRLWPWTYRLLEKWKTVGLSEEEGRQLLLLWRNEVVITSEIRQSNREHRFKRRGNAKGLQLAAIKFEKDIKTIKRWCEKGFFPDAYKTKGGHWRIPANVVESVSRIRPNGFGRRPKSLFGTKVWKEFKKDAPEFFGKHMTRVLEFEAALRDMSQSEFLQAPVPPSSRAIDLLATAVNRKTDNFASLCNLARRLQRESPTRRLNYKLLADAMNIVPSTLYRRYKREGVREAIRSASLDLRPDGIIRKNRELESKTIGQEINDDPEAIAEKFQNIVVSDEDAKSPFIHVHEPQNQK